MNSRAEIRFVLTETLEIAYEQNGDLNGRPVILLHGFPDDPRSWDGVVSALTSVGFRTIVPYLRGFGATRFLRDDIPRSGQQAALAHDLIGLIDGLKIDQPILCGYDWGARAACTVSALWPERLAGLVSIGGYNVEDATQDQQPAPALQESQAWYQWYFHTQRGRNGLEQNRRGICRLLWQQWSPNLRFTDAIFEKTARSFDNPDFVEVVIHSYRHRYGSAPGDPKLETIERKLADQPRLNVPTIVLHGASDGVHSPELSEGQQHLFPKYYERRLIGVAGHLFPREAPEAVLDAIRDLAQGRRI